MKTTKKDREETRKDLQSYGGHPCYWEMLLDDVDTLESRLKWAEEMLERAKEYIQCSDENHSFLSDLAKGFPGGADETQRGK